MFIDRFMIIYNKFTDKMAERSEEKNHSHILLS